MWLGVTKDALSTMSRFTALDSPEAYVHTRHRMQPNTLPAHNPSARVHPDRPNPPVTIVRHAGWPDRPAAA